MQFSKLYHKTFLYISYNNMSLCIAIFATVASATSCLNVSQPMPQSEFSQTINKITHYIGLHSSNLSHSSWRWQTDHKYYPYLECSKKKYAWKEKD
jgi:hypothetical protein